MLGCQDFCGQYEWTFYYVRRRWGQEAVRGLWAEAIGGESQQHYADAALQAGLRGLYEVWTKTGEEEACDWTFTLDEDRNVLRWDMRQCPSKGFLLNHDLNADEDYCDHCMGWMVPLLKRVGVEVAEHEHNHCGQCWGVMRRADRPSQPLEVPCDIRRDPRWRRGFLERWEENRQQPLVPWLGDWTDSGQLLEAWFAPFERLLILGDQQMLLPVPRRGAVATALVMTDRAYVSLRGRDDEPCDEPVAVLVGQTGVDLAAVAARFLATPAEKRPLLLHPFLPALPLLDFVGYNLPRPVPVLPLLIRKGLYTHRPGGLYPGATEFLVLLGAALGKPTDVI